MIGEFFRLLSDWGTIDTWTVLIAALAAMACALPGVFLLLRRQSMLGDALSHTVLPGIVLAFLASQAMLSAGWLSPQTLQTAQHGILFVGALGTGILTALASEWVRRRGQVESSAALGVVYTTLFASGLLLLRLFADNVHIDADCVLFGAVENLVIDPATRAGAARFTALVLGLNLALVVLLYKELRICTFDPALATTLGINARWVHLGLVAITSATLVTAFEIVGSILVVAMLIVPAATSRLCTDRLSTMIVLSLVFAAGSAVMGHVAAITLPAMVFQPLGFAEVQDASTSGMMTLAAGGLFVAAFVFSPRYGLVSRTWQRARLGVRIASEDLLGRLFRKAEHVEPESSASATEALGISPVLRRLAAWRLQHRGLVSRTAGQWQLTTSVYEAAAALVRSHRLWEAYLASHQDSMPDDQLHFSAHRAEHYIDSATASQLASELNQPAADPHGKPIPEAGGAPPGSPALDQPRDEAT